MAETGEEKKLRLKLMVNVNSKKVVFAEADEEFVNFIISLMSLPLSTATRVLLQNKKSAAGSLGNLYNSIESLDTRCFEKITYKDSVLKTRATVTVPLLSLHELAASDCRVFQCQCCRAIGEFPLYCCGDFRKQLSHTRTASEKPTLEIVRGGTFYIVTDSLEIKPMSIEFIRSRGMEIDDLEAKQVQVGLNEGLAIMKASMETDAVLTTAFMKLILV